MLKDGFFAKRWKTGAGDDMHLIATCGWDSNNHKQNDEFSFCLDINGQMIFDDPGYSTACSKETTGFLKSEEAHSNFSIEGYSWSDKRFPDGRSQIKYYSAESNEKKSQESSSRVINKITMHHSRFEGCRSERELGVGRDVITITDKLKKYDDLFEYHGNVVNVTHRFVLSPEVTVEIHEKKIVLTCEDVKCFFYYKFGNASLREIPYVGKDKKEIQKTFLISIESKIDVREEMINQFFIEVASAS